MKMTYDEALQLMQLPTGSDKEVIKKQFRKLAKLYHSDLRGGNGTKMMLLNSAYSFLLETLDSNIITLGSVYKNNFEYEFNKYNIFRVVKFSKDK